MRNILTHFIPRKHMDQSLRNRLILLLAHLAAIYDALVCILSLGFYGTHLHAWVLFDLFPD